MDKNHICYDCIKRNIWLNRCDEHDMKRDLDWCKEKCQREKECLYWKEIAENETSAKEEMEK